MKLLRGEPGDRGMLKENDLTGVDGTDERVERDDEGRVMVRGRREAFPHLHVYPQFLGYLAAQALFTGFTPVDLAAGKLPLERHGHGGAPLGGKDEAVPFDDGTGDVDMHKAIMNYEC